MSETAVASSTPTDPPPKPHAAAASARLRELADDAYAGCRVAAQALGQDLLALRSSADLTDRLRNTVLLLQSAAHLAATAKQAAEMLRPAIVHEMERSGCYALPLSEDQKAILADKPRTAVVTDKAAVHERFWFTPKRRVDLDALCAELLAGEKVEGAELSPEGKTLSIRSRQRRGAK